MKYPRAGPRGYSCKYAFPIFLADSIIGQPDKKVNHWTTNDRNNGAAGATAFVASTRTGAIYSPLTRVCPRIIELYQIFSFIVNYGTIRMELWIGCEPLPLDGFRRVRPQTSFNLLMSWIPLDGSYLARIHYDEVSVALMHSCQFKKGG